MIPHETIERIYNAAKIEEVVGDYVHLHKRGANLIGLCPFHNEKTGSFTVSPSKGIYKCFGCGASGHAVGFIMEIEQCSYVDALKQLGKKYHIEVEERILTAEEQQRQDNRESMFVVNEFTHKWFQEQLWDTQEGQAIGLSYFRERGLRDDIIRKYQLGYSPERGNPLAKALQEKGFSEEFIVNNVDTKIGVGVVGKSEDGRLYDRFRDRVIFPIFTVSGKPVAFAGRILKNKDNVGKYVNSPDSIIYSKTNELYGLYQAKQAIARTDMCYLVEGQMDVISMHQSGIENVVASGGTALTKPQIRLIKRFTSNITVLYDGDSAGIHAALRGINMFLEEGFNVKVVLLPDGEDPDSFAQSHDASEFIQYIADHQTDFIQFKLRLLSQQAGNDPQKRNALVLDIASSIAVIPNLITRRNYIKDCAMKLHVDEESLMQGTDSIRRKKIEEDKKTREAGKTQFGHSTDNDKSDSTSIENAEQEAETWNIQFLDQILPRQLEKNYYNLIQLIVRYGENPVWMGDTEYPIGELIISTLKSDGIAPTKPIYQKIMDEFSAHYKDEGFKAETFFKFHQDVEISSAAVNMIVEPYQLSSLYTHQAEGANNPIAEKNHIGVIVAQYLYEIKLTIVNMQIEQVSTQLKEAQAANDWERQRTLLAYQPKLMEVKREICKRLGNRIITI